MVKWISATRTDTSLRTLVVLIQKCWVYRPLLKLDLLRVYAVERDTPREIKQFVDTHQDQDIGCLAGEHKIQMANNVKPVVQPPRRIPHLLRDQVKIKLDRIESIKIIKIVKQSTK